MRAMTEVPVTAIDEDLIDTILGENVTFEGEIKSSRAFMIKGKVKGRVEARTELHIAAGAEVEADLKAAQVIIFGRLKGRVEASSSIQVMPGAHVEADLSAPDISIEHGGVFVGTSTITEAAPHVHG